MTYPTVDCPGPIVAGFRGKKYDVFISWDGVCDGNNGVFIIHNKETGRNVVVIDGLDEYEIHRIYTLLSNVKDIDEWVNTTFEMDKPISGKHAQEYFEDRLCEVIHGKNSFAYRLMKALWGD